MHARATGCQDDNLQMTVSYLERSEKAIARAIQERYYQTDLEMLQAGSQVGRNSCIRRLAPIIHDGILRVGGRLVRSNMTFAAKHPIILPSKSHPVRLLIAHYHEIVGHMGCNSVLSALRERYWIIRGHATVRSCFARMCHMQKGSRKIQ